MKNAGFTLVELLVAMAIVGMLAGVIVGFFTSTSRDISNQTSTASQASSVQRILGLIGDDIRRSDKIIEPVSTAPTLPMDSSGITPPGSIGSKRIDLYLSTNLAGTANCSAPTYEYEYRSYFAIARSTLVTNTSPWLKLPSDSANNTKEVIVQYIGCAANLSATPDFLAVRLVMDYVKEVTFSPTQANVALTLQAGKVINGREIRGPIAPAASTYYSRRL